jgi:hypothetical protein
MFVVTISDQNIKKKVCSIANLENIFNVTHTALVHVSWMMMMAIMCTGKIHIYDFILQ